tara:strand:- start:75 stop:275 length:201 start_codon:yes stop_codon:yes gene_type:complete
MKNENTPSVKFPTLEEDLIQNLIYLSREADMLWEYHPNNIDGKNLIKEYEVLKDEIKKIEYKLNSL